MAGFGRYGMLAALMATAATGAYAQTAAPMPPEGSADTADADRAEATVPSAAGSEQEIVVTAQKRSERIQDVPIAVSAFTSETLERRNLDSALDLQLQVPNLLVVGNDRPTIRGVGNNAISPTADNGTGVLYNFAPIGVRPQDEFYDVERIEVLRGPQGTLYGRNTTGGTINLITRKAGNKFEGYGTAEAGNYGTVRLQGAVNVPFGNLGGLRLAGFALKRDGYTKNIGLGGDVDGRDQYSLRGSLRVNVGPDTRADVVFQHSKEDSTRSRENKRLCKATPVLGCSPVELGFDSPDVSGVLFQTLLRVGAGPAFPTGGNIYAGALNPTDLRTVANDISPSFKGYQDTLSVELSHSVGPVSLIALSGYTKGKSTANTDYDNAVLAFRFSQPVTYNYAAGKTITTTELITSDSFIATGRTYYQEFRAVSDFKGNLDFTVGANYFDTKGSANFIIYHPGIELFARNVLGLPAEARIFNSDTPEARTKSVAAFGELYYRFADTTKLTVGLRYTKDKKSIRTRTIFLSAPPPYTTADGSYDAVTGRVVLDHKLTPRNLVYASYARGFKGGGLNVGNTGTPTFDPEFINAYELGSKNSVAGLNLQANFSAFYYDYKGLQLGQRLGTSVLTVNSDAKVYGLESEFVWEPVKALIFNANASYLHTKIGDLSTIDPANPAQYQGTGTPTRTPAVPVSLRGNRLPYSPKYKLTFGGEYSLPLGSSGWKTTLRGDYSWQSTYFAREFNTSNDRIKAWGVANALLRLTDSTDRLSFEAYVKNIGNKDNISNSIIESDLVGSYRNARILDPRTYGIVGTVRF
ncbi:TonB-dependent receptor [Sphingomonas sp. BN140010]|uniref:TonB-dependent receptor n=1 Tax=Sphingomonas arvum TaxID=2992113 RepID=A0ABT3JCU6_9SPHN|nr:TonB-dependent receptor [Sphingomonas sp. BN140010]MCW3796899.1 TonB-dependent receptor [Sphingomonas sp. BN140010]